MPHLENNVPGSAAINVRGVCATFEGRVVLDNVSLEVLEGEYYALVGPSGAGKSTLLRLIAGHVRAAAGEIVLNGALANDLPPSRRPTSLMFQEYSLFDHLNNWENILFPLRVQRCLDDRSLEFACALAKRAGLSPAELKRRPTEVSGGERQRIALIRSLVWRPKILLLDEPLASVDPSLRGDLKRLLVQLTTNAGVTTVHVTHSLEEAFELASKVGVLLKGRLSQASTPRDLYLGPGQVEVACFIGYVCVALNGEAQEVTGRKATAVTAGVLPARLRPAACVADGPRVEGVLMSKRFLPDGATEHYVIDVRCAVTNRARTIRVAAANADPNWTIGGPVQLACSWCESVLFDSAGSRIVP